MKYKNLTDINIRQFKKIYKNKELTWDERMRRLMDLTNKSERTVRVWAIKLGFKERDDEESKEYIKAKEKVFDKTKKTFFITYAQNGTPVHERFFNNIKEYAKYRNASIHVIAGRYQNPTSIWPDRDKDVWDKAVLPYLDANRHNIHRFVSIMSDIKIRPTAVNPMTGLQAISGENSCVFGSPKVQMEMIPVLANNRPKMMVTTGACTLSNYTDSKSGKKGEFHHTLGFVVIEIKDDETFYIRQVTATQNGNFTDLWNKVEFKVSDVNGGHRFSKSTVIKINKIAGIVYGDIHCGDHDQKLLDKTKYFLKKLKPKTVVLHDIFNGHSISHHERKDPFIQYKREMDGSNSIKLEVNNMLNFLKEFKIYKNVVIVRSNHDDFIDRWLKDIDWKKTTGFINSLEYMKYAQAILDNKAPQGIVPYLINNKFPFYITLDRKSSYKVKNWEVGQHGDVGANGSRGSLLQFRKLNTKIIVGHYHSPGRKDGALAVGTSTYLRVSYNDGPSSWLQSHVIIHKDGKAQHINFIKDEDGKINFTTIPY